MSKTKPTVIIVGGGIFGCSTALELHQRGYTNIFIVEPGAQEDQADAKQTSPNPLCSSADVSKLVRGDYGDDELYCDFAGEAIEGWKKWNQEWKEDLYHEVGLLNLSTDKAAPGTFPANCLQMLKRKGYPVETFTEAQLRFRFGIQGFQEGYVNKRAGWVESGEVVARLLRRISQLGVIVLRDSVKSLVYDSSSLLSSTSSISSSQPKQRVIGVDLASGRQLYGDQVIVATGAWTPMLLPWLRSFFSPSLQSVFHFKPTPEASKKLSEENGFCGFCADITRTGYYGFPIHPKAGIIKVGHHSLGIPVDSELLTPANILSTGQRVREKEEAKFRHFLKHHFPLLADAEVVSFRLCPYEDTFDGHFLIDHDPLHPGLLVAAGGSGHGFKFGPVIGKLISDVLEGVPNKYAHRFAWRSGQTRLFDACRFVETTTLVNEPPTSHAKRSAL